MTTDVRTPPPGGIWEFLLDLNTTDESWTWRRKLNGLIEQHCQQAHAGFGKVMADAMRSGFNPSAHRWLVCDKEWTTHFDPGAEPRTVHRETSTTPLQNK